MDPGNIVIKVEAEDSVHPPGIYHCPVFHTAVKLETSNDIRHDMNGPRLTIPLVRLEESRHPEVIKYFEAVQRSQAVFASGGDAILHLKIKNECVDLETLTEENMCVGGGKPVYADPWHSVIDLRWNEHRRTAKERRSCRSGDQKSTNTERGLSHYSAEFTTTTRNITAPSSRSTEFKNINEKPHECHVCKRTYAHKATLNRHILIHTGKKPHECHMCKRTFADKSTLINHMLIHTGEKPHECYICKRPFRTKSILSRHITIHSGKKSYECHICKKTFTRGTTLKMHMLVHTGRKDHKCHMCKRTYIQKANFNNHMLIHTDATGGAYLWKKLACTNDNVN